MKPKRKTPLSELGEFGLIRQLQTHLGKPAAFVSIGIGDDCAVYDSTRGMQQVITTDALVEGIHFKFQTHPPLDLGYKTVAVNISDLAAMGAIPRIGVIAVGIPPTLSPDFLNKVYQGLGKAAREYGVSLVGGDTVRSSEFWLNLTVVGEARKSRLFSRGGARRGHAIYATGTLGDSALGLKLLNSSKRKKWAGSKKDQQALKRRHLKPSARLDFSRRLAQSKARISSMIDISDGLVQDLGHLCKESKLGADLDSTSLPLSQSLEAICSANKMNPLPFALGGGEDYELLFTSPSEDAKKLEKIMKQSAVPYRKIGIMTGASGKIRLLSGDGTSLPLDPSMGYNHFRNK